MMIKNLHSRTKLSGWLHLCIWMKFILDKLLLLHKLTLRINTTIYYLQVIILPEIKQ